MKKYYFEIQFMDKTETHWTKSNSVDNARDAMWDSYRRAVTITFIKEIPDGEGEVYGYMEKLH